MKFKNICVLRDGDVSLLNFIDFSGVLARLFILFDIEQALSDIE